jgi:hypothetical protein
MVGRRFIAAAVTVGVYGLLMVGANASLAACRNEALRAGSSAELPDCRAYELVTPADSSGRTPIGVSDFLFNPSGALFPTEPVLPSGESFAFMTSNQPVGDIGGLSGTLDVSLAERLPSGWQVTRRLSPGEDKAIQPSTGGVSADHSYAFTNVSPLYKIKGSLPGGSLAAEGDSQYLGKPDGSFELVGIGSVGGVRVTERLSQGRFISVGGQHVIFSTGHLESGSYHCNAPENKKTCPVRRLADNAPPEGTGAVYDRSADGLAKVVSLLPGLADPAPGPGEDAAYQGVSNDGTTVAFKIGTTMYVRVPDAEDGHTLKVAEGDPVFAGLSDDGQFLFYVAGGENGTIHRFDTTDTSDTAINPTGSGEVVNISSDGSHVYFIAEEEIGGKGEAGGPNLFVWEEGSPLQFIATVAPSDLVKTSQDEALGSYPALTRWTSIAVAPERQGQEELGPGGDSSRTTPDGRVIVFESRGRLTGYENAKHTEIYRYEVGSSGPECVSCNFGNPATSDAQLQDVNLNRPPVVLNNLSFDGSRVFFETGETLVAGDVDHGVNDIYEWHPEAGGPEVHLISSGQSESWAQTPVVYNQPRPNVIYGITASGSDVLFLSQDELVPGAGVHGTPQVYDAREGGGFPPPLFAPACSEEGCRTSVGPAPLIQTSASENAKGANVVHHRCHSKKKKRNRRGGCSKHRSRHRPKAKASSGDVPSIDAAPGGEASTNHEGPASPAPASVTQTTNTSSPVTHASSNPEEFGIEEVSAEVSISRAALHPDLTTTFSLNHLTEQGKGFAGKTAESIGIKLPPGLLGNPRAVPTCSIGKFLEFAKACPPDSQVGIAKVLLGGFDEKVEPIFNLELPHPDKEVARLGFYPVVPVYIDLRVRTASDYGVDAVVHHGPGQLSLLRAEATIWGNPAAEAHDEQRFTEEEKIQCNDGEGGHEPDEPGIACLQPEHKRHTEIPTTDRKAFLTNPSACQQGSVGFEFTSYQLPGQIFTEAAPLAPVTDCQGLPFAPGFNAEPTNHVAGAPTGLSTKLVVPQHLGEEELATATMREARVTLPEGMQIAAGAANWIGTCSDGQVGFHEEVDAVCPDSSKLGTATITSPALSVPIEGNLYQRTPSPGHQFGLWLVSDQLGLHIKLPGELRPDPSTGRLTAVFTDLPQVPVEEIDLNVWGGPRAPLENPDHCGTFVTDFTFSPHSDDPAVSGQSQMQITEGCIQGFDPKLSAGVTNPVAGKFSPLIVDLAKADGQQNLRGFELKLPDGELAKIKGVPLCPDAAATSGACPADSSIGSVTAAAGPGPEPFWVPAPGKPQPTVYLAGPYKGDPFSVVTVAPAQAGPFDLGNLVVRSSLGLDPDTNRAVVKADPLPQFFEGVGLTYRRLHIVVDRPGFSLNPTDCSKLKVDSNVTSTQGAVAHPAAPFQLEGCKKLKFKPKLTLKLAGGTKRASYPALTAILKARKGDANIAKTSVALPHSEFLAQEHIGTICTRKQFAVDKCPKGSIYGKAKAWTPLLAKPLSGPVYLRSSNHLLPDLVVALGGELNVNLDGRIDSKHGGIRASFEAVPDAPVTKFVLTMRGGSKSLLTNSTDICAGKHQATVRMAAQNGRTFSSRPALVVKSCGKR